MNTFKSWTRSKNGGHSRHADVWAMFVMKSWQPIVELLVKNVSSNGCGDGFRRSGVPVGTVALPAVTVGAAVDEDVGIRMSFVRRPVGDGLPAQVAGGEDVEGSGVGEEVGGKIDEDEGEGCNA